jgi:hypothetical protein
MRPMHRRLFTLLSAVSLAMCVATCVLWARSYCRQDEFCRAWRTERGETIGIHNARLVSDTGQLAALRHGATEGPPAPGESDWRWMIRGMDPGSWPWWVGREAVGAPNPYDVPASWVWGAFARGGDRGAGRGHYYEWVRVPHWSAAGLAAVSPACWAWRRGRSRRLAAARRRAGLCLACGYDLRATPERCSDCGTVPTEATT